MNTRKITALICAFMLSVSLTGCLDDEDTVPADAEQTQQGAELTSETTTTTSSSSSESTDDAAAKKDKLDTDLAAVEKTNSGTIKRTHRTEERSMGDDGTWTIMVYMCGSDLESENAMASLDIAEMMESSIDDNVRFLVLTGGAKEWQNGADADKNQIYCITGGNAELVSETDKQNMASSDTLSGFIEYGIENYPAAKMGLILWDHGSGSIDGVCYDDFNYGDSLLLKEMDAALYSVYDEMTSQFEFIGFDACLMSTVETAAVLASHAKYMIASEETEPGYGWDYTKIGNFLDKDPDADGAKLGKVICDSFYECCEEIGSDNSATLSVIDLSKIDDLMIAFDSYAKDIYELSDNNSELSKIIRNITAADNFGGNNKTSSFYTNMVDLAGIINAGEDYSENAAEALSALDNAVVYAKNGSDHKNACGLSCYYPLKINGSQELGIFKDICISAYYLGLVDKIAYGAASSGNIDSYDNFSVISDFSADWSEDNYDTYEDYSYTPETEDEWDYFDSTDTAESDLISFEVEPTLLDDGTYGFVLTQEAVNNTNTVEAAVYLITDDMQEIIELGYTGDILYDWDEGIFVDNFDGYWFSLPDGQLLAAYLMSECDGYDLYSSPVTVNNKETNLIFAYDYIETEVYFICIWDGISETGAAARTDEELKAGDVIVPLYYSQSIESDDEGYYYGDEYIYDGESEPGFNYLYDGEYLYGFIITDIFGNCYETDYINFTVEDDNIYFDDLKD